MVPAGNKSKRLSLVNHTTKTIHRHHHHHHQSRSSHLEPVTGNFESQIIFSNIQRSLSSSQFSG